MIAVMGITGQVGGAAAEALLQTGKQVRGIVRDAARATAWQQRGCELVEADTTDRAALAHAFQGVEAAYVMLPPIYDPQPGFPEAQAMIETLAGALRDAAVPRVVALSTVGGHVSRFNLLEILHRFEEAIVTLPAKVTRLRAAWFLENAAWDVASAREGSIASHLQPLDRAIPMVSAEDVGRTAAALILDTTAAPKVVELEGPQTVSPNQIAEAFANALGKPVQVQAVPRNEWEQQFRAQGMQHPEPRIAMLDGFNEGWISFEGVAVEHRRGEVSLQQVIGKLVARA